MPPKGLVTALNAMREMSVQNNSIYHQYVPVITDTSDISVLAQPILNQPAVQNEFMSQLINQIVYTKFTRRYFKNKLQVLEGEQMPLGYAGREIYVNPAKARRYNVNDFAGLLQKYQAKVGVVYHTVNADLQYPVTVSRHALKKAFTSWTDLDTFIDDFVNSLYNGAYIDEYRYTKDMVSSAYMNHTTQIRAITAPTTEQTAKNFVREARTLFLNFQEPTTEYNAYSLVGDPSLGEFTTWADPENVVFIVRNDILAQIDVDVLAISFNIDRAILLGNIIGVNNFDVYNDAGEKVFDGSNIYGMIADKSWFNIRRQDMYLDQFYNANNRTWQYYLNVTKMYSVSPFANAMIFAGTLPDIAATNLTAPETLNLTTGGQLSMNVIVAPANATTAITYTSSDDTVATVAASTLNPRQAIITAVKAGSATITAKAGDVTAETEVTVADPVAAANMRVTRAKTTTTNTDNTETK